MMGVPKRGKNSRNSKREVKRWAWKAAIHSNKVRRKNSFSSTTDRSMPSNVQALRSCQMIHITQRGTAFPTTPIQCRPKRPFQLASKSTTLVHPFLNHLRICDLSPKRGYVTRLRFWRIGHRFHRWFGRSLKLFERNGFELTAFASHILNLERTITMKKEQTKWKKK